MRVIRIAVGPYHTVALLAESNDYGQCNVPSGIENPVASVAAGGLVALLRLGRLLGTQRLGPVRCPQRHRHPREPRRERRRGRLPRRRGPR
jgi:hypothetical protein